MLSRYSSIISLLISLLLMCIGNGLLNTVFALRASIEEYPTWFIGLMTSGYYLGFAIGTILAIKMIAEIGNIRCFAIFASVASAVTLGLVLFVNPFNWLIARIIYGMCLAGLYVVIESWLNSFAKNDERGRIFGSYMVITYLGLASGQALIAFSTPDKFILFAIASILLSVCLVPLTASKSQSPESINPVKLNLKELYRTSPLSTFGSFAIGIIMGSYWGLMPIFLTEAGFGANQIATFIAFLLIGGLTLQMPIGYLSDKFDRRIIISFTTIISVVSCLLLLAKLLTEPDHMDLTLLTIAFLIGGSHYTLYSLFVSLLNDFLEQDEILSATSGMLRVNAYGSIIGPMLTSLSMFIFGYKGFIGFTILIMTSIFIFSIVKTVYGRSIPSETSEDFVVMPTSMTGALSLDPRIEEE